MARDSLLQHELTRPQQTAVAERVIYWFMLARVDFSASSVQSICRWPDAGYASPLAQASAVPENVKEAREWIDAWKSKSVSKRAGGGKLYSHAGRGVCCASAGDGEPCLGQGVETC
jgi:hypothetical protein